MTDTSIDFSELPPLELVQKALCEKSLRYYIEKAWEIVEPGVPFLANWHIDAICDHLEAVSRGQIRNLIINISPRCAKSLLVSVFWPTWEWITNPRTRWMFASYGANLSIRDSIKCRNIIESPWYKQRWSDRYALVSDQNAKERYDNNKTGFRIATSVGGWATGEGGDRIVVDDCHSVDQALSEVTRTSQTNWFTNTFQNRYRDPKTVARVIIMQRIHEADLTGVLIEQGGYEHLCIPMEYEGKKYFDTSLKMPDPRTDEGECMWTERFNEEAIRAEKVSSFRWAGQYQQRPVPIGGGLLKKFWWRYWRPKGVELPAVRVQQEDGTFVMVDSIELPERFDKMIQSWDMTFKDLKTSDYVVGGVIAQKGANKYLLDIERGQWNILKTQAAVKRLTAKWPAARAKYVEDKANGPAVIQSLREEVAGLIEVNPEGGKIARVNAISPEVESGNYYLPHPSLFPWVSLFIDECTAFPNGTRDDQVDMLSQGGIKLQGKRRGPSMTVINSKATEAKPKEQDEDDGYYHGSGRGFGRLSNLM